MSKQIRPDYNQQFLLPPRVEDWVPPDHPARFIREFTAQLDTAELGFRETPGDDGRPHYAPDVLLCVWLYGYFSRITSTRRLERACMENMALIWLTGNRAPDHNTLWRFFDNNKKAIGAAFKQMVRLAAAADLVGLVLHAVDGTKIKAAASNRTALHKKDLEKILAGLDALIDELAAAAQTARGDDAAEYRLPEELAEAGRLREKIRGALEAMNNAGLEHAHPEDPDVGMIKCDGRPQFAYNAQAVTDGQSGLIVAADVVSDAADNHLLVPMTDMVEETLGAAADATLADGGYESGEAIAAMQEKERGVVLPMKAEREDWEYHSSRFAHDAARDVVVCPLGEELVYERTKRCGKRNPELRIYRCKCEGCPARRECSSDKRGRMIEIGPYHEAVRRQLEKQRDAANRAKLKKRMGIIERVFASVKNAMGFRRFTVNGLDGVRAQWSLVCLAYNLKIMHGWWTAGRLALNN
jgi:transposase